LGQWNERVTGGKRIQNEDTATEFPDVPIRFWVSRVACDQSNFCLNAMKKDAITLPYFFAALVSQNWTRHAPFV
jgi:hypothetical protein